MTEAEWRSSTEQGEMIGCVEESEKRRKIRLFCLACCRRVWGHLTDARSRAAVEAMEVEVERPDSPFLHDPDPNNLGLTMMAEEVFQGYVMQAHAAGWQVAVHAIGDRAIDMVLDAYEQAIAAYDQAFLPKAPAASELRGIIPDACIDLPLIGDVAAGKSKLDQGARVWVAP